MPTTKISDIINSRKDRIAIRKDYIGLFFRLIFLGVVGYLIFTQVFLVTQAKGMDMFPAIKDGDLIIGFRLQKTYQKGNIITYRLDGEQKIGRIIARETDIVTIEEEGTLRINGTVQSGEIMYPTYAKEGMSYPYNVPVDHVFVLGDYRTQAKDSRDVGPIPVEQVEGKVITILRRRGL